MNARPVLALAAATLLAHPLGNFSISHYTRLHATTSGLQVMYVLDFAEIPTQQLARQWGTLDSAKADEAMRGWVANGLKFHSQGRALTPFHTGTELELADGASGMKVARVTAMLQLPAALGTLDYEDTNFAGRAGWKEIVITEDAPAHVTRASHSRRDVSRALTRYQLDLKPPHDLKAHLEWTLDGAAAERIIEPIAQPPAPAVDAQRDNTEGEDRLSALLREKDLPWTTLVLALVLAAGLGALHALEPGHGKTIVAAYLVGTRGTWQHAVYLGGIVTFTHTFSVFLLGLATLFAAQYWPPERIFPILSVASGLSIVGLGLWLLWQRSRGVSHHHHHTHDHSHSHHHHSHDNHHGHHHHHHHHDHDHGHDHGHHHHHHPPENVTWGNLAALGISGGIVPCPAAMVLLLSCIGMGRIALGLSLLVAFSAGLAVVLTAIGLLVLFAKDKLPASAHSHGWTDYLPVLSALAITIIGAAITARALGWV
jgi:nickel/cobalt transporter (NicO) family protein